MTEREPDGRLSALEWARERLENTLRIAALKTGEIRDGWLEDAEYWREIVAYLTPTPDPAAALPPLGQGEERDATLDVAVIGGRLVISIGVNALAFAVTEAEGDMRGVRVTDAAVAADEIRRELRREEEDGTTLAHMLLDRAALAAWENGAEGFHYDDESTPSRTQGERAMRFRKKPVVVEAVRFHGHWQHDPPGVFRRPEDYAPYVVTIHGQRCYLAPGDWIIAEPDGVHLYPCKPDIFAATYEPADAPERTESGA